MSGLMLVLIALEMLSFFVGALSWQKIKSSYWRFFVYYLGVIACADAVGVYLNLSGNLEINKMLYGYFAVPLQLIFYIWLFARYFNYADWAKKLAVSFSLIYLLSLVVDLSQSNYAPIYFESFSYTIGCILLLVWLWVFFIKFVRSDEILNYKNHQMFWVSLGLLFFYVGTLPFFAFRTMLYQQFNKLFMTYWVFQFFLAYLMNIFFILSFLLCKPKQNYSL